MKNSLIALYHGVAGMLEFLRNEGNILSVSIEKNGAVIHLGDEEAFSAVTSFDHYNIETHEGSKMCHHTKRINNVAFLLLTLKEEKIWN